MEMKQLQFLTILHFLFLLVLGNTENIRIRYDSFTEKSALNSHIKLYELPVLNLQEENNRLIETFHPMLDLQRTRYYRIDIDFNNNNGNDNDNEYGNDDEYEIRICWPASQPIDFSLEPIIINGFYLLELSYISDYYSSNKSLMIRPNDVKAMIIINKCSFLIPSDLSTVIKYLIFLFFFSFGFYKIFWTFLVSNLNIKKAHTR